MTTEEDIKDETADEGGARTVEDTAASESLVLGRGEADDSEKLGDRSAEPRDDEDDEDDDAAAAPAQLGSQRFVYAAYFAGGIAVAFLLSKAISYAWERLALWKPQFGEPNDEVSMPLAALIGALIAFYYYKDEKARTLAEEVASELGKVTWPTRDEVVNGTFVVIVTTFVATAFFALMDRFWGFVTNLVYGA